MTMIKFVLTWIGCCIRLIQNSKIFLAISRGQDPRNWIWNDCVGLVILSVYSTACTRREKCVFTSNTNEKILGSSGLTLSWYQIATEGVNHWLCVDWTSESSSSGTSLKHICQPVWNTGPRWTDSSFTRVNHKRVLSLCQKAVHPEPALIDWTVGLFYQKAAEFLCSQAHTGHWPAQEEGRGAQQRGRRPALQHWQASQQ